MTSAYDCYCINQAVSISFDPFELFYPSDAVVIMSDTVVPHFVVAFLKWFMVPFAVSAGSERPKTLAG